MLYYIILYFRNYFSKKFLTQETKSFISTTSFPYLNLTLFFNLYVQLKEKDNLDIFIYLYGKKYYILREKRYGGGINRDITDDTRTRSTWKAGTHLDEEGSHEPVANFVQSLSLSKHWIHQHREYRILRRQYRGCFKRVVILSIDTEKSLAVVLGINSGPNRSIEVE